MMRWPTHRDVKAVPLALGVAALLVIPRAVAEEGPGRPAYQSSRFDEDWSALRDPAKRTDPFDPIKFIPLNVDGSWYATLGGELRERFESSRNPLFGLAAPARNDYLLHRAYLFADIHYGPNFRAFVQIASGLTAGWTGTPPATQKNDLDFLQGFGELSFPVETGAVMLRAGRQEMSFGSSRLVSVRESPNFRRSFDAVRGTWNISKDIRVDAFVSRPVAPQFGVFDDGIDENQTFWGVYATAPVPGVSSLKVDVYYFGIDRRNANFAQGIATERRETIGARLFGKHDGFDWNTEGAFQFGSFGASNIQAWTVSTDVGYTFAGLPFTPRVGLKADAISGDKNLKDGTLGTFNPLFPKLPYFSEANLVAPMNLLDIQPNLTLSLTPKVSFNVGWNPFWKQEAADAVYSSALTPVKGTAGGSGRYIGQQVSATLAWAATSHLNIAGTYVHYTPGERVRQAGGQDGDFVAVWAQFLF